ncbi:MAG: transposase [Verrucomicrobiota bacterium]
MAYGAFFGPVFCCISQLAGVKLDSMARANRLRMSDGGIYHVTHRCHNRSYLLKFAVDRKAYRSALRKHLQEFQVTLLDYCITCNHVHLLIDTPDRSELGGLMHVLEGEFARAYNKRKERINAFWGDNYHATLVEGGDYLWRCLCYIELNMVRCGVVRHPREWDWVGHHEIMGTKTRNRLLDLDRLCWRLCARNIQDVRRNLDFSLAERIARDKLKREPIWTESLAVGSSAFVSQITPGDVSRCEVEVLEIDENLYAMREVALPYGRENGPQNRSISPKTASFSAHIID